MTAKFENGDASVVVVIGSGAGGGTLAHELSRKGVQVVCLEAGPVVPTSEIVNDAARMFGKLTWLDTRIGKGDLIPPFPVWSGKGVGGTTLHWTASSYRLKDREMRARTTYGEIKGTSLIDWPVSYRELAPYYAKAEAKMGVTGTNGNPHLPGNNNYWVMRAGAKKVGYKQIDTGHLAINSTQRDGRPACQQMGFCISGCAIDAKWTTANSELPKAAETGKFELRPNCIALRINHNAAGKVTGVVYRDAKGAVQEQKARVVCVACNAVDSARLLLASVSARYPNGLANGNGQVGGNYMRHMFGGVVARMPKPVNWHRGTQQAGIIHDEQRHDPKRGFGGGFNMELVPFDPATTVNFAQHLGWGKAYAEDMRHFDHMAGMLVVGEDFPEPDNRITLHPTQKDKNGLPVPVVRYAWHDNSKAMMAYAQKAGATVYEALNAVKVFRIHGNSIPATHNMGTCRMSAKPADGVCNKWGRTHEVANLFVSDGGLFTSSGAQNPTLTIVALAIRQADHIAEQMRTGAL